MIDMKAEVNGLNEKVVKMLAERKMTVSAAESCTGGLFAALITNVSGASEVLNESFVTYANSAKMKYLGVKGEVMKPLLKWQMDSEKTQVRTLLSA